MAGHGWRVGDAVDAGWRSRSLEEYAAAEAAWQRSPERAELMTATRLPASWRLPKPQRANVEAPSIRLDADADPRVTVILVRSAVEVIDAECLQWGDDVETGGWLVGHRRGAGTASAPSPGDGRRPETRQRGQRRARRPTSSRGWTPDARRPRDRDGDLRGIGGLAHPPRRGRLAAERRPTCDCWACELATIGDPNVSYHPDRRATRPGPRSWRNPQITAWITRHARSNFGERMVCEPAIVSVPRP